MTAFARDAGTPEPLQIHGENSGLHGHATHRTPWLLAARWTLINRNFLDKSQGTLEATLGRRLHEIFPPAFQDTALDQQIREVIVSGTTLHRQRMSYRAPGVSLRVYSYSICPLRLHGGARGAILVMDDVTDHLRLSEEVRRMQVHLGSVVESAGDLIISTDPCGVIMTWNSAAELATGYRQDEMCGRLLADQIGAPQDLDVADCFRQIARIGDLRGRMANALPRRSDHPGIVASVANDRHQRRGNRRGCGRAQPGRAARHGGADAPGRKTCRARHGDRRHCA